MNDRLDFQLIKREVDDGSQCYFVRSVWRSNGLIASHSEPYRKRSGAQNLIDALEGKPKTR